MIKPSDGPLCLRDLTRRFSRLPTAECHDLLLDMEAEGRVTFSKGKWSLSRGRLAIAKDEGLLIET